MIVELMPPAFTLSALQLAVEAVSGVALHEQNFRRVVERTGVVDGLGRMDADTGGRPAEIFRFRPRGAGGAAGVGAVVVEGLVSNGRTKT